MLKWKFPKWIIPLALAVGASAAVVLTPKISKEKRLLQSGQENLELRKYDQALIDFEGAAKYAPRSPEGIMAAEKGAQLAHFKANDFNKAIFFYRSLVLHSDNPEVAREAQRHLGEIYYEKLNDYGQAILEFQRALQSESNIERAESTRLKIARSYFFLANFDQAIAEGREFLRLYPSSKQKFEAEMIIGNALLAQKNHAQAILAFEHIEKEYAKNPDAYQASLNKALVYEEKEELAKAISTLQSIQDKYPQPDILELKIKAIQKRLTKSKD